MKMKTIYRNYSKFVKKQTVLSLNQKWGQYTRGLIPSADGRVWKED